MKLFNIIKKNFKLLLRNKSSALVILLGPLLIILLISLAFNDIGSDYILTLGVYSPGYTNATETFITGLEENYEINRFEDNSTCIDSVKKGITNACLLFPGNLILDDETQDEIFIYVDQSRINIIDAIINRISSIIGVSSEATSKDLTATLLTTITLTKTELESNLFRAINIKQNTDTLITDTTTIKSGVDSMDLDMGDVDLDDIGDDIDTLYSRANSIKNDALDAIEDALDIIEKELGVNYTKYEDLNSTYAEIESKNINSSYRDIISSLDDAAEDIEDVASKLSTARTKRSNTLTKIDAVKTNLNSIKSDISELKSSLESISESISSIKVMSAESIVNPITTTIKPISSSTNKGSFMLPYLIILIVMFIGIMLSGTSIIIDKMSPAAFRTFTAPTKDSTYLVAYYLTNIIILLFQLLIIGGIAFFFLKLDLGSNLPLTSLIIFLASSLFIFVGMAFGYLLKSQEAVTISSLSISSVLLFVSNLVIPLESTPLIVQTIAGYNPYVMLSEALKKVMFFNVHWLEVFNSLGLILVYILVVFILILIIQKLSKIIYFKKIPLHKKSKSLELGQNDVFRLSNGKILRNKRDLLKFLENCSNSEFQEYVDHKQNKFSQWIKDVLGDKRLARKIRKLTDKEKIIKILEENIAKGIINR